MGVAKLMKIGIKALFCIILSVGCYFLCNILKIAAFVPTTITVWGILCLLFSWELSGSKLRVRNGIEQKTPLQLMWIVAGIVCLLSVAGFLFTQI